MLPKLLVREWILTRRALLPMLGIFAIFQAYFVCRMDSPRQWLIFAAVYASFLSLPLFLREDKFRANAWSCTLPVCRQDLVRARFQAAWILVTGTLALALVLAGVMPGSRVQIAAVFDPATLFLAAAVVTIILGLMLPFAIRFGFMGIMIFLVGIQVLGTAVLLVAVATSSRPRPSRGVLTGGIEALTESLVALRDFMSPPGFYLLVALALILANWLGFRLAVALFRRREF
jgi:hypothetical protein